ncbi:MAG: HAD hydrolase family protein [Treponema sp.]|nr:HAD hydrolase family protein [Treponema sp.]
MIARTLFVTDFDGTLLRGDRTLSHFTASTIRSLIERGILITYATARTFKLTNQIDFKIPVITRNGTIIASQVLKKEIRMRTFGICRENRFIRQV